MYFTSAAITSASRNLVTKAKNTMDVGQMLAQFKPAEATQNPVHNLPAGKAAVESAAVLG